MTAAQWLAERAADAPPHLRIAMIDALNVDAGAPIPDALADGALRMYRRVVGGEGGREDAFPLLVADALLTHAFEAQAEMDAAGVMDLARRTGGAGHLGSIAT